ncbi:winged helix-turn-helix transcriptional regulator [Protaetiibacter mangrovi]|uniref:Helix-turn-helix transcriptional regulator n=1 Tax=Protaetiibacter mangrovi TaxID=2970926 RepID=A0ABT1ZGA4_9MICO|nr:helix-turn-helix domain-containing protein [Protaetiibacter mangrovi]MCS0499741.1 helix-turn-helix transcriptional regulator [Protaetiibacter mangrovi]TPW94217.1 helix-turn-helix transcriptional regulator [Schumannella luteola]
MDDIQHIDDEACRRLISSTELVGRRWSSGILLAIGRGATRFSAIVAAVDGLSDRMAAQRLRELEASGLVDRTVVPTTPVQVRYRLTRAGDELLRALQPLASWGHRWGDLADGESRREAG